MCQCLGDAGDEKFRVCRVVNLCSVSSPVSLGCGEGSDLGDASGGSFLQYASPVCSRRSGSGDGLARGRAGSAGGGGTRWSIESSAGDDALLTVDQGIPRQPRPAGGSSQSFCSCTRTNQIEDLLPIVDAISQALETIQPGQTIAIPSPERFEWKRRHGGSGGTEPASGICKDWPPSRERTSDPTVSRSAAARGGRRRAYGD